MNVVLVWKTRTVYVFLKADGALLKTRQCDSVLHWTTCSFISLLLNSYHHHRGTKIQCTNIMHNMTCSTTIKILR